MMASEGPASDDGGDVFSREREWPWLLRVVLVLGSVGLYAAVFLPMYRRFGRPAFSLSVFPAVVGGALLGPWGVAGTALALLAANRQFVRIVHYPLEQMVPSAVLSTAASVGLGLAAAAVARLLSERRATSRKLTAEIDQRRATEKALRQSSRLYQALVESLGAGVALFDEDDRCTYANQAAVQAIGVSLDELLGQPFSTWWDEATRERRRSVPPTEDQGLRRYEVTLATPGNRVLLVSESPWHEQGRDAPPETLRVLNDVTERVALEQQQRRLEVELERNQALQSLAVLTGGVAHDFNNLLGSVVGNAELALLQLPPATPPSVREILRELTEFAVEAGQLSKQMLAYAGGRALSLRPANLNSEVEQTLGLLRSTIESAARLTVRLEPELPELLLDRVQIRQVLTNLVLNALEAMRPGRGLLTVSTGIERRAASEQAPEPSTASPPRDCAVLTVSDTGKGVAPEHLPHILEPSFSTKDPGRGMGLAACLGIARGHHGWIDVESQLGVGTTFRVMLPLMRGDAVSADQS